MHYAEVVASLPPEVLTLIHQGRNWEGPWSLTYFAFWVDNDGVWWIEEQRERFVVVRGKLKHEVGSAGNWELMDVDDDQYDEWSEARGRRGAEAGAAAYLEYVKDTGIDALGLLAEPGSETWDFELTEEPGDERGYLLRAKPTGSRAWKKSRGLPQSVLNVFRSGAQEPFDAFRRRLSESMGDYIQWRTTYAGTVTVEAPAGPDEVRRAAERTTPSQLMYV